MLAQEVTAFPLHLAVSNFVIVLSNSCWSFRISELLIKSISYRGIG